MEKFKAKLKGMYNASGGKKADIISHSMGGILVKSFLALHHDVFYSTTEKFISLQHYEMTIF
jgi:triacylglycerol esterase/lipase EstA (alpha/beta hydrolase family)